MPLMCFGARSVRALAVSHCAFVLRMAAHKQWTQPSKCPLSTAQDGTLLSFGRPTYGRLGRSGADVNSDEGVAKPMAVDGLGDATIVSAAAGVVSWSDAVVIVMVALE